MLRELGIFEKALVSANRHAPFNIVSVLRMEMAPRPERLRAALEKLQQRHPLLQTRIAGVKKRPYFEEIDPVEVPFFLIERKGSDHWRGIAEQEMGIDLQNTPRPLFRAVYLYDEECGELVLNAHHAIMDAASGVNLLDELLRICAGEAVALPALEPVEALERRFPPPYAGLVWGMATIRYALSQTKEMLRYQWRNRGRRLPPLRTGGRTRTANLVLPEVLVDALSRQTRKAGLTLNSVLNAALMLATNRHLYNGLPVTTRTFTFADVRPFTHPPTPAEHLGSYISMLGLTLDVSGNEAFWTLSNRLHKHIYRSLKGGDKFSAVLLSEKLLEMITRYKFMRFGATALSYSGVVPLLSQYGDIKVTGLHGFVSGFDLGPELASQARLFHNQLWWDFVYLESDMDEVLAERIIAEIRTILESASRDPV